MAGTLEVIPETSFVQCPTRDEHEMTLITPQIIPKSLCLQRQKEHFHKCHRCQNKCALAELGIEIGAEFARV